MGTSAALTLDSVTVSDPGERVCDVAIVGAGPYGLSAAARLRALEIDTRVFGEPMSFWTGMPRGMLLRSAWDACHIGFPDGDLTLDSYKTESGGDFGTPVPLEAFIDYGRWFQRTVVPDVDSRRVTYIKPGPGGFRLLLEDGATLRASRVVIAAGIEAFTKRPVVFDRFSPDRVTHSSEHRNMTRFTGGHVLVIGGGQSALESAALLHEAGARVEVIARKEQLVWLHHASVERRSGRSKPSRHAQTDVGSVGLSRLVAAPDVFRRLPRGMQAKLAYRAVKPAGARWLIDRLAEVPITTGCTVVQAKQSAAGVHVTLDDGSQRLVDHVILGTGYRVDISAYGFLAPELIAAIRQVSGYPALGTGLESSVPGLHFLGAPAAWSFGPIMRFVSGSWYGAANLATYVRNGANLR
jgi:cation diffusion facilitator CzcD-associated flavoprotein CzcO